jgi:hypothetical protein
MVSLLHPFRDIKCPDRVRDPANLRPPAENITKETKGRKSNKRAKLAGKEASDDLEVEKASVEEKDALEEEM